jgi:uncharacterized protein (TIGR02996 family)
MRKPMNDHHFLHAIRESPEEDSLRLAYAAWLEQQGDPRGELIRVECEILAMQRVAPQGWGPLRSREKKLLRLHVKTWLGPFHDLVKRWKVDRGLFAVQLAAEDFLRLCPPGQQPPEQWAWVNDLEVRDLQASAAAAFAASLALSNLNHLDLYCSKIGLDGMAALASSHNLARLAALELAHNAIGPAGVAALTASPHLRLLTRLNLFDNQIGDRGVQSLLAWPYLDQLTDLHLQGNGLTDTAILNLAASPRLANLNRLDLAYHPGLSQEAILALVHSPYLENLRVLWLDRKPLSEEVVALLWKRFGRRVSLTTECATKAQSAPVSNLPLRPRRRGPGPSHEWPDRGLLPPR